MLVLHRAKVGTTLMKDRISGRLTGTQGQINPPGRRLERNSSGGEEVILPLTLHDLPRASSRINDNYCVTKLQTLEAGSTPQTINTCLKSNVKLPVASHVHTAPGHSQKRELSPRSAGCHCKSYKLKSVKSVSCVTQLSCVQPVTTVKNAAPNLPVGARLQNFWQTWLDLGAGPKVVQIRKEGYTLPFRIRPRLTRSPTVISCYVNPHRNSYLLEALHQLIAKNAVELVKHQTSLGFFNRLFLVPKPNNKWRPILDLSKLNLFLKTEKFKMETPETIRTSLQQGEWVTSINFKDAYFHIPIQEQSRKCLRCPRSDIPIQSTALWSVHSTLGVHCDSQRGETDGHTQGYKNPPVPRRLVGESHIPPGLSPAYSKISRNMSKIRLAGEFGQVGAGSKTGLRFCRIPVRSPSRSGPTDPRPVAEPSEQNLGNTVTTDLSSLAVHVTDWFINSHREASSPRPATHETHTVAPQKPLENTRITRKGDPNSQIFPGQPLHPIKHALQIFTDASKEGWGAHLNEHTARGTWSLPESKLHINYLELKAVFLALKEFQSLCINQIVLVATDNTTVVAYINKEGGLRSSTLCALLWRILTWCTKNQVTLKARHIPGRLNVVADKLIHLGQTIQTEWSLLQEVFQTICRRWHRPQIDLFATRFNNKLPQFVSPVPDSLAVAVDALGLQWEGLDAYAFPPAAILGKVVEKLQDSPCM